MKLPFWKGNRRNSEVDEEIQSHLTLAERDEMTSGHTAQDAHAAARKEFGSVAETAELTREAWGWRWFTDFIQDIRYGLRTLRKNPGFTAVAVLTLALGIGANSAIFSVVDRIVLKSLPVSNPEGLVQIAAIGPTGYFWGFSYPSFQQLGSGTHTFSGVVAVAGGLNSVQASVKDKIERADCQLVSANFFSVLGVNAVEGRPFDETEDQAVAADQVVVISYDYWNSRFQLDRSIIGKTIVLRGTAFTIVGVAPKGFFGVSVGTSPDIYVPLPMERVFHAKPFLNDPTVLWLQVLARLKPGVNRSQALTDTQAAYSVLQSDFVQSLQIVNPKDKQDLLAQKAVLIPAANGLAFDARKQFTNPLLILMGIVVLVMAIACANVANLLLARGASRRKEIAVRLALGAGRGRLIRQLLAESLLLSLAAAVIGILVAEWATDGIVALMSVGRAPLVLDLNPDFRLIAFSLAISLLTAVAFGLAPAWRATEIDVAPALKEATGRSVARGRRTRLGKSLIVSQVAISIVLLFGAGLLVRTLINLRTTNPGFDRKNVLLFHVNPNPAGYQGVAATVLYRQILERLDAIPGIESAGMSFLVPVSPGAWLNPVEIEGYVPRSNEDLNIHLNSVTPGYFETLRIPLLRGRAFQLAETPKSPLAAVINQSMARRFFGTSDPVGKKFGWLGDKSQNRPVYTIVGVVGDAKYETLRETPPPAAYLNALQDENEDMSFEVRTSRAPEIFVSQIRASIQQMNGAIRVGSFESFSEHIDATLARERLMVILAGLFAGLAALLACIGLYGVTSYGVALRRREIGIRMALGAKSSTVLWMVQKENLLLVATGIAIGLPFAIGVSQIVSSTLFGVHSTDPVTVLEVALMMATVAFVAGYLPAHRASRVDPIEVLRQE